jgi:HEAT repeat protein
MGKPPRYRARYIYLFGWIRAEECALEPGEAGEFSNQAVLMKALEDHDPLVRGFAIQAIVRLRFSGVLKRFEDLLEKETEPVVLRKAAEALGQIGTPGSIKVLESKLKVDIVQKNQSVRSAYRSAIQEIRERYGI